MSYALLMAQFLYTKEFIPFIQIPRPTKDNFLQVLSPPASKRHPRRGVPAPGLTTLLAF